MYKEIKINNEITLKLEYSLFLLKVFKREKGIGLFEWLEKNTTIKDSLKNVDPILELILIAHKAYHEVRKEPYDEMELLTKLSPADLLKEGLMKSFEEYLQVLGGFKKLDHLQPNKKQNK